MKFEKKTKHEKNNNKKKVIVSVQSRKKTDAFGHGKCILHTPTNDIGRAILIWCVQWKWRQSVTVYAPSGTFQNYLSLLLFN